MAVRERRVLSAKSRGGLTGFSTLLSLCTIVGE